MGELKIYPKISVLLIHVLFEMFFIIGVIVFFSFFIKKTSFVGLIIIIFFALLLISNIPYKDLYRLFKYLINKKPEVIIDSCGINYVLNNKFFDWQEINKIDIKERFYWRFLRASFSHINKYYCLEIYLKNKKEPFVVDLKLTDQKFDDVIKTIKNYKEVDFGF
ncbi:hypothetical protein K9L05_01360 [Candidatus Babeliales bacterium]|nr:hypothetical protein [Candidatus Babeliales bacterium]MCF7899279.1 hypothetical protein [Candidatus Babeliales bacterium]